MHSRSFTFRWQPNFRIICTALVCKKCYGASMQRFGIPKVSRNQIILGNIQVKDQGLELMTFEKDLMDNEN